MADCRDVGGSKHSFPPLFGRREALSDAPQMEQAVSAERKTCQGAPNHQRRLGEEQKPQIIRPGRAIPESCSRLCLMGISRPGANPRRCGPRPAC